MWVKDYMFTNVCTVSPEATIGEVVKIMVEKKTNSLIVVDKDNKPVGTLSSYTLIKEVVPEYLKDDPISANFGAEGTFDKYAQLAKDKKIKEVMHKNFHILSEKDAMIEAAAYAIHVSRRLLPVTNKEGVLIGAITRTCIKNALYNAIYKDNTIVPTNGGCGCK